MSAHFTPWLSLCGGCLLGLAAALLLLLNGRVAGVSGILSGLVVPERGEDVFWRWLFAAGLGLGGLAAAMLHPAALHNGLVRSAPALILAGLLVGSGAALANGCTSGHGLCGLSRLSPRSFAAVFTFIATGSVTVVLVHRLWGGAP